MTLTMNVLFLKCIENQYQISFLPCSINREIARGINEQK